MVSLALATVSAILYYFLKIPYLYALSIASVIGYIVFGLLSKPNYKRMAERRMVVIPLIVSRLA